jgi:hypothetical protein
MWKAHLLSLLGRSWSLALATGSSTTISAFVLSAGSIILGFILTVAVEWLKAGRTIASLWTALRSWPAYLCAFAGLASLWIAIYVWAVCATVYLDHQSLWAANTHLKQEKAAALRELDSQKCPPQITPKAMPCLLGQSVVGKIAQHGQQNIAQMGNGNQATITLKNPEWLISDEEQNDLITQLSGTHGRVRISAEQGHNEAFHLAGRLYEIFHSAGWTIEDSTVRTFITVNGISFGGITVHYDGPAPVNGKAAINSHDHPAAYLAVMSLSSLKVPLEVSPATDNRYLPDEVDLDVGPNSPK